jgi:elongation factor G
LNAPPPLLRLRLAPLTAGDRERLASALRTRAADDPSFRFTIDPLSGGAVVEASGEDALDWALDALKRAGVNASVGRPEVICREIITREAEGEAKHAKYVEGRGQYAHVRVRVAPAPPRGGNAVVDRVIGGAIPSRFIADVSRAVELVLAHGVGDGHPLEDVEVEILDGSYHEPESSGPAFHAAAEAAVREALGRAGVTVVEPVMRLTVFCPAEHMPDVLADIASRSGRVVAVNDVRTELVARAPLSRLFGYAVDLRARTRGAGRVTMAFDGYEPRQEHDGGYEPGPAVRMPNAPRGGPAGRAAAKPDD